MEGWVATTPTGKRHASIGPAHLELLLQVRDDHVAQAVAGQAARCDLVQPKRFQVALEHQHQGTHGRERARLHKAWAAAWSARARMGCSSKEQGAHGQQHKEPGHAWVAAQAPAGLITDGLCSL